MASQCIALCVCMCAYPQFSKWITTLNVFSLLVTHSYTQFTFPLPSIFLPFYSTSISLSLPSFFFVSYPFFSLSPSFMLSLYSLLYCRCRGKPRPKYYCSRVCQGKSSVGKFLISNTQYIRKCSTKDVKNSMNCMSKGWFILLLQLWNLETPW